MPLYYSNIHVLQPTQLRLLSGSSSCALKEMAHALLYLRASNGLLASVWVLACELPHKFFFFTGNTSLTTIQRTHNLQVSHAQILSPIGPVQQSESKMWHITYTFACISGEIQIEPDILLFCYCCSINIIIILKLVFFFFNISIDNSLVWPPSAIHELAEYNL